MRKKQFWAYLLLYNFIYFIVAAGGWLWEVLLYFCTKQQFVNRGFMHGPWLPVYGLGAVVLSILFYHGKLYQKIYQYSQTEKTSNKKIRSIFFRKRLSENITKKQDWLPAKTLLKITGKNPALSQKIKKSAIIFLTCALGGGLVEYAAGWLLWHGFHKRYWDYSGYFGELNGYVCLFSIIGFGTFGLLWVQVLAPRFVRLWERIAFPFQILLIGLFDVIIITDAVFSLLLPNAGKHITFSLLLSYVEKHITFS